MPGNVFFSKPKANQAGRDVVGVLGRADATGHCPDIH